MHFTVSSSGCSVFDAFEKVAEMSIEDTIKRELSGDFERLMLAVGKKHATLPRVKATRGVSLTQGRLLGFSSQSSA